MLTQFNLHPLNEKKLCFQGVLDKSWYLCPLGCCHYRIQTDYENGFRIRIMCPDESKMKIYYKCNMIKNKCSIRTDYESTSTIRDGYHLVILGQYDQPSSLLLNPDAPIGTPHIILPLLDSPEICAALIREKIPTFQRQPSPACPNFVFFSLNAVLPFYCF